MTVLFFSIATGDEAREQAVDRTQVPKAMGVADKNACNHEFGVALDVGHTPERPGTLTARGRTEYEFNLHLAESIRSVLIQRGYKNLYLIKTNRGFGDANATRHQSKRSQRKFIYLITSRLSEVILSKDLDGGWQTTTIQR